MKKLLSFFGIVFVLMNELKSSILILWFFFFSLSLVGQSPYNLFQLILISGGFSISIVLLIVITTILFQNKKSKK